MPNEIANNMADTINQLDKELKDLREENKVLISECDRLIKEKGELLSKVSGGDVLRICQLEEQLEKAKELLKFAVEDFSEMKPYLGEPYSHLCDKWRYTDEAEKLLNDEK
jgi:archaellum component FlaC